MFALLRWTLRLLLFALVPSLLTAAAYLLHAESGSAVLLRALSEATDGAIRAEQVAGPLAGPLTLDGLVYEDRFVRVEVDGARLDWNPYALLLGTLSVHALDAARVAIVIKPQPRDPEKKDVLTQLPFTLHVGQVRIARYEMEVEGTSLRFDRLQLAADWTGDVISVDRLHLDYAPVGALDLTARLRMEPRQLSILEAQLSAPAVLQLEGRIGYEGDFAAAARWQALQWPLQDAAQLSSSGGTLKADGRWQDYAFALDGAFAAAGIPFTLGAQGRGSTRELHDVKLQSQLLRGRVQAQGGIAWQPQLQVSLQGQAQGLDPAAQWPQWPGRIGGTFQVQLQDEGGTPAAVFGLDLRDSRLRGLPFLLSSAGDYRDGRLMLERAELRSGGSRLRLRGRASAPYDLSGELDSPDLAQLLPALKGRAKLSARFAGTPQAPQLQARGEARQLSYAELSAAQLTLDADLHPHKPSRLKLELQDIDAGFPIGRVAVEAAGTAAAHRLRAEVRSQAGDIELGLAGALDLATWQWRGELASGRGVPEQLPPWQLEAPAALQLSQASMSLEPACWRSESGRACAQFARRGADTRVAFRLQDWAFAYFRSFLPPQWTLSGSASGTGLLVFGAAGLREAQAELRSTAGRLSVGSQVAMAFDPSSLDVHEAAKGLDVRLRLPLQQAGGGLEIEARLAPGAVIGKRRLSGRLGVDFSDLTPLRILSSEIEAVRGQLRGEFALSGTAARPRSEGRLNLSEGSLKLGVAGIELQALQAELRSSAESDEIELSASAQSGGGRIELKGQTDPLSSSKLLRLHITGRDFQAANLPQARVWISPDLRFDLARDRADLVGVVEVPRADILPRSFAQGIGPSRDQVILGPQGEAEQAGLLKVYSNVRIVFGDNVKFDGFGLKSKLQGAISAVDEPGRPTQGRGEIRLVEGRYKAYGQDLTIETGRLLFTGGLITDPAVELRAVRQATEEIRVGIHARGTLASPQFTLYSTPDMPQDQQLSWLVLGRGIEADASAGERSAVSNAALSLGMSGGTFLTQKLGAGLKLDEVSIGAKPGQTADQAQFTIGKYLSPKLYVSYGIGVFQPGHSFRLLYDIGRHFKFSTESGVESGGDLLYSIERD